MKEKCNVGNNVPKDDAHLIVLNHPQEGPRLKYFHRIGKNWADFIGVMSQMLNLLNNFN